MHDFGWLASPQAEGAYFRNHETISGYASQMRTLEKQFQLFGVLSFLGASIILAGGFPADSQVNLFGVEFPTALVSLQLLAVFVSICFTLSMRGFGSLIILKGMLEKLLEVLPQGSEFVVARFDASQLWGDMLRKRTIGYQSPWHHTLVNGLISFSGLALLALHLSIVGAALWTALVAAWPLAPSFPFFISLTAALNFLAAVILFFVGFFIPVPYRASKELREHWERNSDGKTPNTIAPTEG